MELDEAISSFLVVEKAESRQRKMDRAAAEVAPFESSLSQIDLHGAPKGQRGGGSGSSSGSSEGDSASEGDAVAEPPPQPAQSLAPEDIMEDSVRYRLDDKVFGSDLDAVVASTLGHALDGERGEGDTRVRATLHELQMELEALSRDSKREWEAQQAEAEEHDHLPGAGAELARHLHGFFALTRGHVSLAQKHAASAAAGERAALSRQVSLCVQGLRAVATAHVQDAIGAQTTEARTLLQWQKREREETLAGSRMAGSLERREALQLAQSRAAAEQEAAIAELRVAHAQELAAQQVALNEERLAAVRAGKEAVAAAQEEAERYAEERDAFADRVTEVQLQLLASEDHCKKVESQLVAALGAKQRQEEKFKAAEHEAAEARKAAAAAEGERLKAEAQVDGLKRQLEEAEKESAEKLAAAESHAKAAAAELEQAREDMATQGSAGGGGPGGSGEGWVDGHLVSAAAHARAKETAEARLPTQVLSDEERLLAAAVERSAKAGKAVELMVTPKKDGSTKSVAQRLLDSAKKNKHGHGHGGHGHHGGHGNLSLHGALAQSHRLYDHAARSLRTDRDATAVSKRHDAAWAKATTVEMPPELGGPGAERPTQRLMAQAAEGHRGHGGSRRRAHGHGSSRRVTKRASVASIDPLSPQAEDEEAGLSSPEGSASGSPVASPRGPVAAQSLPRSLLNDCYEYQLGATGHARLALAKMSTLQKALLKHRTKHVRLDLWCRFLGFCAADERYPNELFRAYVNTLEYVRSLQREHVEVEQDGTLWTPLRATHDAVVHCFGVWLSPKLLEALSKEGHKCAVVSISMSQKAVPFDEFVAPFCAAALAALARAAQTLKVLYWAADTRADGQLSLAECKALIESAAAATVVGLQEGSGSSEGGSAQVSHAAPRQEMNLLALYRRLGIESSEHGAVSEVAWVRSAFDCGLVPTYDGGGRPFLRAAKLAWTTEQGALGRVQAALERLHSARAAHGGGAVAEGEAPMPCPQDGEIADWTKRAERVEAVLAKRMGPNGGRESGIAAVRAVRAVGLRLNESEGRVLSPKEQALLRQDDATATNGDEIPMQTTAEQAAEALASAAIEAGDEEIAWGGEEARERVMELRVEKAHAVGQLTKLRMDSEQLVEDLNKSKEVEAKLDKQISELKHMVAKYTMGDFQSEIARKEEEITRLNTELTATTEALERAQAAAQKGGRKRTMKGVGRGVVAAGRLATDHEKAGAFEIRPVRGDARPPSPRDEPQPEPQPEGTAAAAEPEQEKHTEAAKDAEARPTDAAAEGPPADGATEDGAGASAGAGAGSEQQPAPHSSDTEMALRQEIVSLQSQLADMSAQAEDLHQQLEQQRRRPPARAPASSTGKEGDPAAAVAAAVGEEGEWVSEEAAVREMIAMIKAAGHVTGLDTSQRRRGFALATASPTKQQQSPKKRESEDSMARKVASSYSSWSAGSGRDESDLSEASVTATAIRTVWRSAGQDDRPADGSEPAARFEAPVRSTEGRAALARLLTKKKRPASAGAARPRQLAAVGSSLDASSSAQSGGGKRGSRRRPRSAQVRRPQPAARPDLVWGGLTDGLAT